MVTSRGVRALGTGVLVLAISGCAEGERPADIFPGLFGSSEGASTATENSAPQAAPAPEGAQLIDDQVWVPAPDIFFKNERALWDGRPSLGGVWVAHPDVTDPERVLIENLDNGKSVLGALFRKERETPGPVLQLSSDAASEIEALAGQPITLKVTALRRQEAPPPTLALPEGAEAIDAGETDTSHTEAAAPIQNTPQEDSTEQSSAVSAGAVATTAISAEPLSDPIAAAEAALARSDDAATGAAEPAAEDVTPLATPVAIPQPAQPATERRPLFTMTQPFIQVGVFGLEENARNAETTLQGIGITSQVIQVESDGATTWRVLVGPAETRASRKDTLRKIRDRGYADARTVAN